MSFSYDDAVAYLAALESRGWRLGLDRMHRLLELAGLPARPGEDGSTKYLHVAGTNGKGTVTAYIDAVLRAHGWACGGYYSPYVYDLRERIRIDGQMISKAEFATCIEQLATAAIALEREGDGPTEFEIKTAAGFLAWRRAGCEFVALEVGMGGRLDATNVVAPISTAIVSIGLDHCAHLGPELASIAREKAGIIKDGVPVVVGQMEAEPLAAIAATAARNGSRLLLYGRDFCARDRRVDIDGQSFDFEHLGIEGPFAVHNLAVALACIRAGGIELSAPRVAEGASAAWLPGRMQRNTMHGVDWILDGAHNGPAAEGLASHIRSLGFDAWVLLAGMLEGHDPRAVVEPLCSAAVRAHFAPIDFHRTADPRSLAALCPPACKPQAHPNLEEAVLAALEDAKRFGAPILVSGSFYLVGEVGRRFGFGNLGPKDAVDDHVPDFGPGAQVSPDDLDFSADVLRSAPDRL